MSLYSEYRTGTTCPHLLFNLDPLLFPPVLTIPDLETFIMPYSQFEPLEPLESPFRPQRVDARPGSSQGSRAGMIDQKLIDGSQQPRHPSSFLVETSFHEEPISSLDDTEPQLDAFGE